MNINDWAYENITTGVIQFLTQIEKMCLCNDQCSSVRPSGRVQKLNVGHIFETVVPTSIKVGMILTTIERYEHIPLLVTFDLYPGHRVSIYEK